MGFPQGIRVIPHPTSKESLMYLFGEQDGKPMVVYQTARPAMAFDILSLGGVLEILLVAKTLFSSMGGMWILSACRFGGMSLSFGLMMSGMLHWFK